MTGIAEAIRRALAGNPNEIFLVEGHTDAVGSDEDNLSLSDRRAETVATVLTQRFGIPAENLTTQGYGEQYLKVKPRRRNARTAAQPSAGSRRCCRATRNRCRECVLRYRLMPASA